METQEKVFPYVEKMWRTALVFAFVLLGAKGSYCPLHLGYLTRQDGVVPL